jgi:hypothetical protein
MDGVVLCFYIVFDYFSLLHYNSTFICTPSIYDELSTGVLRVGLES